MKTIGLICGMSWESSAVYYKLINEQIKEKLGGLHSSKCIIVSVDFAEIADLQHSDNWQELEKIMIETAQKLEKAGADFVVLCTNTMHKVAPQIEANINVPFLHIADATAIAIQEKKIHKIGLLGTKFTMEQDFIKGRIFENFGIECIIPNANQREIVHHTIYNELVRGIISNNSRILFLDIIEDLISQGAEGIILGCTEIGLLITNEFTKHLLFDTTEIHANFAVKHSLL
jgi:aspartate racemase